MLGAFRNAGLGQESVWLRERGRFGGEVLLAGAGIVCLTGLGVFPLVSFLFLSIFVIL